MFIALIYQVVDGLPKNIPTLSQFVATVWIGLHIYKLSFAKILTTGYEIGFRFHFIIKDNVVS